MAKSRKAGPRTSAVPEMMKAAAIDRFGPPSVLKLHRVPVPEIAADEVLIASHGAGVGVWDADVRNGSWRPFGRAKFPLIPGTDGAGTIAMKGARVRRFALGERVWAYHYANPKGGFYAEYVAAKPDYVGRVPRHLDLLHAGAAATTGLTALQGIDDALRLRRGETILIFGASGAVGTLAVQFAKRLRGRVLGTASSREATALVRRLGADAVIDAREDEAIDKLRTLAPGGLDAVLALAGGPNLERCIDLVRPGGRVSYPNGVEPEPGRRRKIRMKSYDAVAGPAEFARLEKAATEVRLSVPLAAVYPLAQAARAHQRLERGHLIGRIVLKIRGGRQ